MSAGLNQTAVAVRACVSVPTLQAVENGRGVPQASTLTHIKRALSLPDSLHAAQLKYGVTSPTPTDQPQDLA